MTNREAYNKAKLALDAADVEAMESPDGGWGAMASHEIYNHILCHLKMKFKQD